MNNTQLYALAKSYLGDGGSRFRQFCGLPSNAAWCAAFVTYIFAKGNDASLFYGGKKVVYVPSAQTWCRANLAEIPLYMAMPMDIITFDWNSNGVPDHIGFVKARKSDTEIYTIEGNTSGGIVAERTRPYKYVSGVWRPQFSPTSFTTLKKLEIDGQFGYNSIACLQLALRRGGYYKGAINGILNKETVKALQHKASDGSGIKLAQDGAWGMKTTKALQKWLKIKVDGWWGINSTKSLQRWVNNYNDWYAKKHGIKPQTDPTPSPKPQPKTIWDKANAWARKIANDSRYKYVHFSDASWTQECCICHPRNHDLGWNCIGFATACWRHGAGIPCKCNCETINNALGEKILRSSHATATSLARNAFGLTTLEVISNSGKAIPMDKLKQGDILLLFDGDEYYHMVYYMGKCLMADSSSGRNDNIKADVVMTNAVRADIKIAIRYTGKITV